MTQKLADLKQIFVSVPNIDENFGPSGSTAKLEVLRTWPRDSLDQHIRYMLIDVNRADANQPIELWCYGPWCNISIEKYDVLIITGARVERSDHSINGDPLECHYRMIVDQQTDNASIIVYNWRDRILAKTGKLYTAQSLRGST